MSKIVIIPHNQLKVKLKCDPSTVMELSDAFSFFVPGYKYMPSFKSGHWDGRVKMFNVRSGEFYKGLLPRLKDFAEEKGYEIEYTDKKAIEPKVKYDPEFLKNWASYGNLEPQEHQKLAIEAALTQNQLLVLSPTGSGKSYICYLVCRYLLEHTDKKILITVPSTSLVEQLYKDFESYAVDFDVSQNVHRIYSGKEKETDARIIISTWQSVYKLHMSWFVKFGAYICDEAHGADSKSISGIVDNLTHAPVRIGLTGTLDGTKLHELEMLARFGPVFKATSTKELMDSGSLAPLKIKCLTFSYSEMERKIAKVLDYDQEIEFLLSHDKRNLALVNLALRSDKNTLMLFNFIERHGLVLYKMLQERAEKHGKKIYYISGSVKVNEREEIRRILETENNAILLASMGTMSVGVNIKNLHNLIFCHPYKAKIKTLQSIGRTIRKAAGKEGATLIDVSDDLCYNKRSGEVVQNTTYKHFIERLKIYESEEFDFKIHKVDLSNG